MRRLRGKLALLSGLGGVAYLFQQGCLLNDPQLVNALTSQAILQFLANTVFFLLDNAVVGLR